MEDRRTFESDIEACSEFRRPSRREFLAGATALTAGAATVKPGPASAAERLPTVALGKYQVTRFIVGSNPLYGYSHFNRQYDQHMLEWFTDDRIVELLLACEKAGIDTWQASYNANMTRQFPKIRAAGCRIQFICLAASWHFDEKLPRTPDAVLDGTIKCAQAAAQFKPVGIAFHGWATDMLYRAGKIDMLRSYVNAVHDLGIPAGISTHNPVILAALEEKNFGNDFYMASLHYLSRRPEDWQRDLGTQPVGEVHGSADPPRMCEAVRKVRRPCLVPTVLAAGRTRGS
ncbi:MAG: twin-arginine translocation signal domain-containing protein, partial [Acidobacteria bacterium]|nr:twin-arginine translocation signal domain-containing protein [Acidobacteriota bacterium]